MKRVAILGSTGSIGRQTLRVVEALPSQFSVVGLAAGRNTALLADQVEQFKPRLVWVIDKTSADELEGRLKVGKYPSVKVLCGDETLSEFLGEAAPDTVVSAISGKAGLYSAHLAVSLGFDVALANKESLVMMGRALMRIAGRKGTSITPIDSEHSALKQCLVGEAKKTIRRLILTASGGPFRSDSIEQLSRRTFQETQRHPVWNMGEKINVDSATLMNKGLEVIEACVLFDQPPENVDVLVHPECVIHSMVEFIDGSWKAQMGIPNMEVPILYALSFPDRLSYDRRSMSPGDLGELHFYSVDREKFRCLGLAYEAARVGGSMPVALCVADEIAIEYFRNGTIVFTQIAEIIQATMQLHQPIEIDGLDSVLYAMESASRAAEQQSRHIANGK